MNFFELEDEIWDTIYALREEAEYQQFKEPNLSFEWELSADIVSTLDHLLLNYDDEKQELMGIPVRINYKKPEIIKLWREVKI